jgi:hypothetical protein
MNEEVRSLYVRKSLTLVTELSGYCAGGTGLYEDYSYNGASTKTQWARFVATASIQDLERAQAGLEEVAKRKARADAGQRQIDRQIQDRHESGREMEIRRLRALLGAD